MYLGFDVSCCALCQVGFVLFASARIALPASWSLSEEKLGGFLGSDTALTMVEKEPVLLLGVKT